MCATHACLLAERLGGLQGVCIPRFEAAGYWDNVLEVFIAVSYIPGGHPHGGGADDPSIMAGALQVSGGRMHVRQQPGACAGKDQSAQDCRLWLACNLSTSLPPPAGIPLAQCR